MIRPSSTQVTEIIAGERISYHECQLTLGWKSTPRLSVTLGPTGKTFSAEIGYAVGRDFEFESNAPDISFDDAVVFRTQFSFWSERKLFSESDVHQGEDRNFSQPCGQQVRNQRSPVTAACRKFVVRRGGSIYRQQCAASSGVCFLATLFRS